jgi:hypothetical protein
MGSSIRTEDSPGISNISHISYFSHDENNYSAGATFLQNFFAIFMRVSQKVLFCSLESFPESFLRIFREGRFLDYILV